jgi:hypothetical protein
MSEPGGLKLLLSYNVQPESVQAYYQFVLSRYIPAMQSMGLEMSEAWHTAFGDWPDRLVGFVARDAATMNKLLADESWAALNESLRQYVYAFEYKVIPYREGFQL